MGSITTALWKSGLSISSIRKIIPAATKAVLALKAIDESNSKKSKRSKEEPLSDEDKKIQLQLEEFEKKFEEKARLG
jgi:hypothetical protein